MAGRNAVVTGGASGIGRALGAALAARGDVRDAAAAVAALQPPGDPCPPRA